MFGYVFSCEFFREKKNIHRYRLWGGAPPPRTPPNIPWHFEEILRNFYNDNKADYDIVEQRSVSKLFVNTGEKAPDEIIAKAKTIITSALEQVNNGDDF